jgi:hypothetical protein
MIRAIDRYPTLRKAIEVLECDNGGHLLEFYIDGPSLNAIVDAKLMGVGLNFTDAALDKMETYLLGLSEGDLETLVTGEEFAAAALNAPPNVTHFLDLAFEMEIDYRALKDAANDQG